MVKDAVVMCAGNGLGLWPITETVPKPCVRLLGRSMLSRILEGIRAAGIRDAHFVTYYLADAVESEARAECERLGIGAHFIRQKGALGTADAVKAASESITGPFMVASGDHVLDTSIYRDAAMAFDGDSAVVLKRVKDPSRYGVAEVSNGIISEMVEKPKEPKTDLANVGIYIFNEGIFGELGKVGISSRNEYEITDVLKGKKAVITEKYWLDVGMPWMLIEAMDFLFSVEKPRMDGELRNTETGKGNVILEEGAVVENASIEGNLYLGKKSRIGPFSKITGSVSVGDKASMADRCALNNSIVGNGTAVKAGCRINSSIIGNSSGIGASCQFADRAAGGKPVTIMTRKGAKAAPGDFGCVIGDRAGIGGGVSVLPGMLICSGARVSPGSVVKENVDS
jgi:bifunctional UDP-N-acetylglucosamine pyrophosphorylase/glucosamine-1-phosphate N-acetyltransferase